MVETTYKYNTPLSIALLGDLHNRPFQQIIDSLSAHKPDLIAIAGDIIYGNRPIEDKSPLETQEHVLAFLAACPAIAPTYMGLGNHELWLDQEDLFAISQTGVTVLDNTFLHTSLNHTEVVIGGLTSAYVTAYRRYRHTIEVTEGLSKRYPEKDTDYQKREYTFLPDVSWLTAFAKAPGYHILISHHPEYQSLVPVNVEMVLSGHAHGGQIRYYSLLSHEWRGLFAPGQGWFPKLTCGIHGNLIVTRGLSNTAWVPRLFNPTELVYIIPLK